MLDLSLYRPRTDYLGSRSAERKLGTQVGNRPKVSQKLAPGGNMEGQEYAGVYSTGKTPINKSLLKYTTRIPHKFWIPSSKNLKKVIK